MTTLSFPGLNIGEFKIDPVAIRIGDNFETRWYGILTVTRLFLALLYASYSLSYLP